MVHRRPDETASAFVRCDASTRTHSAYERHHIAYGRRLRRGYKRCAVDPTWSAMCGLPVGGSGLDCRRGGVIRGESLPTQSDRLQCRPDDLSMPRPDEWSKILRLPVVFSCGLLESLHAEVVRDLSARFQLGR